MGFPGEFFRRSITCLLAAIALAQAPSALAQGAAGSQAGKISLIEPPTPLLPASSGALTADQVTRAKLNELQPESFDAATCLPVLTPAGAPAAAKLNDGKPSGCLSILKEDSLLRLAATRYHKSAGDPGFAVAAFEFDDATGAYSAYTFFRSRMHDVHLSSSDRKALSSASETSIGSDSTLIWAGPAILRADSRLPAADIASLVSSLPKTAGRRSLAPLLPTFFPPDGLDRSTIRYSLGPVAYASMGGILPAGSIDWSKSTEAGTAAYSGRGGRGTFTLLLYPTPQLAGIEGRAVQDAINKTGAATFGTVRMRRLGPLVGITSGSLSAERAEALIHALNLNEVVTFDTPKPVEFHAEMQKTYSLLQNIAAFVGVMLAAAILLALFLGGARAGIRVLMGKPAASEPEFLTINLRGRPAPLHMATTPAPAGSEVARTPDQQIK